MEAQMQVALLTRYFNFTNAGIGRVSNELLKGLLNHDIQVDPVSTNSRSLPSYLYYSLVQSKLLLPSHADIYHAVTPVEGLYLPSGRGVLTILDLIPMVHPDKCGAGIGYNGLLNKIGTEYFSYCARTASKKAEYITTISEMAKGDIVNYLKIKSEVVQVVTPGISNHLDKNLIYKNNSDNKRREFKIFGYLGQLDRRKRVDVLIKSFKSSAPKNCMLFIAGIGRDREKLKELAGSDKRIEFLGFISEDGLSHFYNYLDYFIFPTMAEGYGLPIVESLACGTPVVTLEDAVIPAEVKDKTIIVRDLREFFRDVQDSPVPPSIEIWAGMHNWGQYVDKHIELYGEVVANG